MLKSKIAIALAAAMVMAALYGCSSGVSDSTHNQVKNQVTELEDQIQELRDQLADLEGRADVTPEQVQALRDRITALEGRPDQDEVDELRAQIAALQNPVVVDMPADVPAMAGNVEIAAGESATIGYVTYTCAAGDVGCTVTVDAHGNAVSTGGMVTAAVSQAYKDEKVRLEEIAKATTAAETKAAAITAEGAQTDDASLGGDGITIGTAQDNYSLDIERGDDGTMVTVTVHGAMDDDDVEFMLDPDSDFMDERTMLVHKHDADSDGSVAVEVALVSTDIEAPKAVEFAKLELADGMTPQRLNARDLDDTVDADGDGTPDNDFTALTVVGTSADVRGLVMSTAFAPGEGDSTEHTFSFDDTTTTEMDEADEVAGTYNGAMGKYRCDGGTACTVTVDDEGAITDMSAGWVFTPDMGATSDQPDYDYLHYGFWLKKTTDKDDVVTYNEVETFADSSIAASGSVASVRGSASYTGGAVGVYVHRTFDAKGESEATSGHFKAAASLTATFGQTTADDEGGADQIAPNLLNRVRGTIDNFVLSGGEGNSWSVALESSAASTDGTHSGTAKGGRGDGSFSATFHGPNQDADSNPIHPHSVVGEFNAGFSNGDVAGAFGARIEDD